MVRLLSSKQSMSVRFRLVVKKCFKIIFELYFFIKKEEVLQSYSLINLQY